MSYTHTRPRVLNGFAGMAQCYNSTNHLQNMVDSIRRIERL